MLLMKPGVVGKSNYNALQGRFSFKSRKQNNAAAATKSGVVCTAV
jgi:hypothetical protein